MADRQRYARSWPVVGILPAMRRAPTETLEGLRAAHGDHATARLGPLQMHLLSDPEVCRRLLRQPEDEVTKSYFYEKLQASLGRGLLTTTGEHWRRQRELIQPLLTPRAVETYTPDVTAAVESVLAAWHEAARQGETVNAKSWAVTLARDVTVRALFGEEGGGGAGDVAQALATMQAWTARRFWSFVDPHKLPSPGRRRYLRAVATIDAHVYPMIRRRREAPDAHDDLLARLVRARDQAGGMAERELRDEAVTMYIAGMETTANALAFALWELARDAELQEQVRDEARTVIGAAAPAIDAARQMPWTRAVIEETLRRHPPIWSFGRETRCAVSIKDVDLPSRATCVLAPWILHRRSDVWKEPDRFDPRRFYSGHVPRAYMPFGAGHRACVGRDFAMMELTLAVALILREVRLSDATAAPVRDHAVVALTPDPPPELAVKPLH